MRKYKILIVEDERQLAEMTQVSFPQDRFEAKACFNGEDALKEVAHERPDLIVLDVVMPGIDGWEVLLKLRSDTKTSGVPVIMCTAKDSLSDVEKSFRYGAQSYIIKPIVFKKLLEKVTAILDIENLLND